MGDRSAPDEVKLSGDHPLVTRLVGLATLGILGTGCAGLVGPQPPSTTAMPTTGPVSAPKTPGTKATPPDLLSGYGATRAAWATGHQLDPSGTGFWPRLADGDDTYTSVSFVRGRALSYTEHLYPAISEAEALKVVNDEMPPDVKVIGTKVSPALRPSCEQLVLSSPTIRTLAGANVLVELYSDGQGYEPQQVTRLTYQPIGQVSSALPSC